MKILVPCDFSKYSENAIELALKLAEQEASEITIFHNIDLPEFWLNPENSTIAEKYISDYKDITIGNQLSYYEDLCSKSNVSSKVILMQGDFLKNLTKLNESSIFNFVVMGTHGVAGKEEWFIGSNTQKAIRKLHNNIFVIKNKIQKLDFSKVAYVTGLNENEKKSFKEFIRIISKYNVEELHILSIDTTSFYSQPRLLMLEALKDYEQIASSFNVNSHFYSDYSIDAGVRHFVEEEDITLVGISNHYRHPVKRVFQGSNVEIICNHSEVPVLSIDFKL